MGIDVKPPIEPASAFGMCSTKAVLSHGVLTLAFSPVSVSIVNGEFHSARLAWYARPRRPGFSTMSLDQEDRALNHALKNGLTKRSVWPMSLKRDTSYTRFFRSERAPAWAPATNMSRSACWRVALPVSLIHACTLSVRRDLYNVLYRGCRTRMSSGMVPVISIIQLEAFFRMLVASSPPCTSAAILALISGRIFASGM